MSLRVYWRRFGNVRYKVAQDLLQYDKLGRQLQDLRRESWRDVLRSARIIGATASGAAKFKDILEDVDIGVVLIEEAGEVLEAHALTSLQPKLKHFIMIGDHQQLRPKLENFELTLSANQGHDFDVSLFERLVRKENFRFGTLAVQHRMRPEIAQFLMPTYPQLQNGPKTLNRAQVRGLTHNVVFIDHSEAEAAFQTRDADPFVKINVHEVELAVAVVRYFLQQGYAQSQLVILTPYLGQLMELRRALQHEELGYTLGERDAHDIETKLGDSDEDLGTVQNISIRVATVDNYQGEEADIVILSLVRSNECGSIGFLREPERVNVMLSRARLCEIIIGNSQTFLNARDMLGREMWTRIIDSMRDQGMLHRGLPACCENHKNAPPKPLACREDFDRFCKQGGCRRLCQHILPCGHSCPLTCHVYDMEHRRIACAVFKIMRCEIGHPVQRPCASKRVLTCDTCDKLAKIDKNERVRISRLQSKSVERQRVVDETRRRMEAERTHLRHQIDELEKQREDALRQTLGEIANEKLKRELERVRKSNEIDGALERGDALLQAEDRFAAEAAAERAVTEEKLRDAQARLAVITEKSTAELTSLEKQSQHELQKLANEMEAVRRRSDASKTDVERQADAQLSAVTLATQLREHLRAYIGENKTSHIFEGLCSYGPRAKLIEALAFFQENSVIQWIEESIEKRFVAVTTDVNSNCIKCLEKMNCNEWLEAHDKVTQQSDDNVSKSPIKIAKLLAAICQAQIGGIDTFLTDEEWASRARFSKDPLGHAIHHLVVALQFQRDGDPAAAYGRALASAVVIEPGGLTSCLSKLAHSVLYWADTSLSKGRQLLSNLQPESETERLLRRAGSSAALKQLTTLIGIKRVKEDLFRLKDTVELDKERGDDFGQKQYNVIFTGNPGTGKTTVARIYGQVLHEFGVLPNCTFEETSGAKLLNGGVALLKKLLQNLVDDGQSPLAVGDEVETDFLTKGTWGSRGIIEHLGLGGTYEVRLLSSGQKTQKGVRRELLRLRNKTGVLFVDEAYQLKSNQFGCQILDTILTEIEEKRGKLVLVFAGYKRQMEELLEHNQGLPSRFPKHFEFADFTDEELARVLFSQLSSLKNYRVEDDKYVRIAARRLGRQRGTSGFGNARATRNLVESAKERQSARVLAAREKGEHVDAYQLTRDDIIGPKNLNYDDSTALKDLNNMIGLKAVKESVKQLIQLVETNAEREENEMPVQECLLNRLFLGNPGTGKTSVASIYGRILKELGMLSKGEVIFKNPSDFIGSVLGESEKKTNAIPDKSIGCVLVIDEAYGLDPSPGEGFIKDACPFKTAVIDTIVARVQGIPGDDRCVLLLGYKEEMDGFIRRANPGLQRRFQAENAFIFEDYEDEELLSILLRRVKENGRDIQFDVAKTAIRKVIGKERLMPNFGNASAVNSLLSKAICRSEERLKSLPAAERAIRTELVLEDFYAESDVSKSLFDGIIGCDAIQQKLDEYRQVVIAARAHGHDPLESLELNFQFCGPPGTGKTTIARRMGKLFENLDVLPSSKVIECSAVDFTTGYIGQSARKTREMFEKARGGTLFIDEAYRLYDKTGHSFMQEVVDEIVTILTEPRFKMMVVIIAGYEEQLQAMLNNVNPGLSSRITQKIHFKEFDAHAASQLFELQLKKKDLLVAEIVSTELPRIAKNLVDAPDWASGRDVDTWAKRTARQCLLENSDNVTLEMCEAVVKEMIEERTALPQGPTNFAKFKANTALVSDQAAPVLLSQQSNTVTETIPLDEQQWIDISEPLSLSTDIAIMMALQGVCVELGYDKSQQSRKQLEMLFSSASTGTNLPKEIVELVCAKSAASEVHVNGILRTQIPAVLDSIREKIKYQDNRLAGLERLNEEAKVAAIAREKALQEKLKRRCPAGFSWYRTETGWRCGGGSHFVQHGDPFLFTGDA